MDDKTIISLAREYAEEMHHGNTVAVDEAIETINFLLRRYALVEKSMLKMKYGEASCALVSSDTEDVKWGTYRLSLLDALFPDLGKEVEL